MQVKLSPFEWRVDATAQGEAAPKYAVTLLVAICSSQDGALLVHSLARCTVPLHIRTTVRPHCFMRRCHEAARRCTVSTCLRLGATATLVGIDKLQRLLAADSALCHSTSPRQHRKCACMDLHRRRAEPGARGMACVDVRNSGSSQARTTCDGGTAVCIYNSQPYARRVPVARLVVRARSAWLRGGTARCALVVHMRVCAACLYSAQ